MKLEIQEVKGRRKLISRQNDPYKRRYKKNNGKRTPGTVSRLKKRLDGVFSQFIRYSRSDAEGNALCYTCGHKYPVKKLHNGHYILRGYTNVRWNESNCRPQCGVCNLWRKGEPVVFRENLVKELGEKAVLELEASRHTLFKVTPEWLIAEIEKYEAKLEQLQTYASKSISDQIKSSSSDMVV
jgi:hypothetical protein